MSRRFGRNQKRHMREALAVEVQRAAQAAHLANDRLKLYQSASRDLDDLRDFFCEVEQRVGRESILAGAPMAIDLYDSRERTYHVPIYPEMSYSPGNIGMPGMLKAQSEILHRLEVTAVRDSFRRQIVARCSFRGKEAGIAMSEHLVHRSTESELVKHLARELARHLARELKDPANQR